MTEHSAPSEWYNEQVSHFIHIVFNRGSPCFKKDTGEWDMSRFLREGNEHDARADFSTACM